jgi:hypothetical protein
MHQEFKQKGKRIILLATGKRILESVSLETLFKTWASFMHLYTKINFFCEKCSKDNDEGAFTVRSMKL